MFTAQYAVIYTHSAFDSSTPTLQETKSNVSPLIVRLICYHLKFLLQVGSNGRVLQQIPVTLKKQSAVQESSTEGLCYSCTTGNKNIVQDKQKDLTSLFTKFQ